MARKRITAPPKPLDLSKLPDDAHIPTHEVARLTGYTPEYIRKKMNTDPNFPQPAGRSGIRGPLWFRIGDVREYLRKRGTRK